MRTARMATSDVVLGTCTPGTRTCTRTCTSWYLLQHWWLPTPLTEGLHTSKTLSLDWLWPYEFRRSERSDATLTRQRRVASSLVVPWPLRLAVTSWPAACPPSQSLPDDWYRRCRLTTSHDSAHTSDETPAQFTHSPTCVKTWDQRSVHSS